MADVREDQEKELDKKEIKKAERARRAEERKLNKQAKKEQKEKDAMEEEEEEATKGGKILVFFVTIIILAIWLVIIGLLIKWDVGGFGSSVLYPLLKDVPYVNKILPEVQDPTKDDPYAFETMDEAVAQIKKLEKQLEKAQNKSGNSSETIQELEEEVARLKIYEQEQAEFEELRKKFYEEVVFGEDAPDIEEYSTYYASINPENAEQLYKQVVSQLEQDEKIDDYVKAYSSMKPKAAAGILEEMTDDLELVAKILGGMKADARGDILAAMDANVAADVTKLMEP